MKMYTLELKFQVDLTSRYLSLKVIIHWIIPTDFEKQGWSQLKPMLNVNLERKTVTFSMIGIEVFGILQMKNKTHSRIFVELMFTNTLYTGVNSSLLHTQ